MSPNSWCGNFVETHTFHRIRMICSKLCGNCAFPRNLQTRKLGEITVFYAIKNFCDSA